MRDILASAGWVVFMICGVKSFRVFAKYGVPESKSIDSCFLLLSIPLDWKKSFFYYLFALFLFFLFKNMAK